MMKKNNFRKLEKIRFIFSSGDNYCGQLCFGDTKERKKFEKIKFFNEKEIIQVSTGDFFTILLSSNLFFCVFFIY